MELFLDQILHLAVITWMRLIIRCLQAFFSMMQEEIGMQTQGFVVQWHWYVPQIIP